MEIRIRDHSPERIRTDLLVVPAREKRLDDAPLGARDRRLRGALRARMQKSRFSGAEGSALLHDSAGIWTAAQVLLIGDGSAGESGGDTWRKLGARARKEAGALGAADVAVFF